jgi:hypothetical protein
MQTRGLFREELCMKYEFFSDPGHGWLKVPFKEIERLGLIDKISSFSFVRDGYIYLEEDEDLSLFLDAKYGDRPRKEIWEDEIVYHHTDNFSRIRTYQPYIRGIS